MRALPRLKRPRRRKRLFVESLEPRIVLDGQLADALSDPPAEVQPAAVIEQFESADELREFLLDGAVQRWQGQFGQPASYWDFYPIRHGIEQVLITSAVSEQGANSAGGFDGTNVQVAGVDEGDVVKTDGEFVYVAANGELSIIDARNPSELTLVSQIALDHNLQAIYVNGDRLTTVSTSFSAIPLGAAPLLDAPLFGTVFPYEPPSPETVLTIYDITDRSSPAWISATHIDGYLQTSRRIDDLIYVVTNQNWSYPRLEKYCGDGQVGDGQVDNGSAGLAVSSLLWAEAPYFPFPPPDSHCTYETEVEYVARVSDTIIEDVLPSYYVTQEAEVLIHGFLNTPEEIYKPIADAMHELTSITVIDVNASTDGIVSAATVPTSYGWTVYASAESVYLTGVVWNADGSETQLLQFAIADDGQVELAAVGSVKGTLLNSFSLDEHEGRLRGVTTSGFGTQARNSLFVLEAHGQQLEVVGQIESIAPGERIFAARFLGDEAFVVTFRQIDPLFTIDLSDPTHPTIQGELEIPGFSNYLHPISEDLLIGLGQDGPSWISSPQVSLFDVSDFTAPERIGQYVFEGIGGTDARYDHHAFSYFADSQILVIPFSGSRNFCFDVADLACRPRQSAAFWVLHVDPTAKQPLQLLGSVEHRSQVLRSLRIGDTLLTVSTESIKATELRSPDALLDELSYAPIAFPDYYRVDVSSTGDVLDVLTNDHGSSNTIIEVGTPTHGGSVAIADDGQSIIYTPPTGGATAFDTFTYTINNGDRSDTTSVRIELKDETARQRMTQLAISDLAELLGIDGEEIGLRNTTRETWPDTCLGLGSPGEACGEALTPGFRIGLKTEGGSFAYHTDLTSQTILASADLPLQNDKFDVVAGGAATTLDVLANDGPHAGLLRIIDVSGAAGTVTISDDGRSLSYEPPAALDTVDDFFTYTVELSAGVTGQARARIFLLNESLPEIEQAAVAALAAELEVDADSISIVASEVFPRHANCQPVASGECGPRVRVGLQHANRFYVYHVTADDELQLNRVFEPGLQDDDAQVEAGDTETIRVLHNDHLQDSLFPALQADPSIITAVSESHAGATITFTDTTIQYIAANDFVGEDVFTYSVGDLQAEVHVHVDGFPGVEPLVAFRAEIVDSSGEVVTTLHSGDEAVLQIFVEDLRDDPRSVFAAYTDISFDPAAVAKILDIEHGEKFSGVLSGDASTLGEIDELGAADFSLSGKADGAQLLARVTFVAGDEGTLVFSSAAPDIFPDHDTLLRGADIAVPLDRIQFGTASVEIVADMHNADMAEDTNGDGELSAIDALRVINFLNESGTRTVAWAMAERASHLAAANASFGGKVRSFLDVNNDGHISPLDALLCINRITAKLAAIGEGESTTVAQPAAAPSPARAIPIEAAWLQSGSAAASKIEMATPARPQADKFDRVDTAVWSPSTPHANAETRDAARAADEFFTELRLGDDVEPAEWWEL